MNTQANKHFGILLWHYRKPCKWNELHLRLWFRDNDIVYPPCHEAIVSLSDGEDVGVWWCISEHIDLLDTIAAKARLSGAYANVNEAESISMVLVDMRPMLQKQVQS